jgi:hypothetical protein
MYTCSMQPVIFIYVFACVFALTNCAFPSTAVTLSQTGGVMLRETIGGFEDKIFYY